MQRRSTEDWLAAIDGHLDSLDARVVALADCLERIERRLDQRADESPLAHLINLVAARLGDRAFSVADLRKHALANADREFAQALDACGSPRILGKLLARSPRVQRIGDRAYALTSEAPDVI